MSLFLLSQLLIVTQSQTAATPAHSINQQSKPMSVYNFEVDTIEGKHVSLKHFHGKVLLIVNVASRCGNTPQYEPLQALQKTYNKKGFEVLGFPANNFGAQEPGSNAEILEFCKSTYSVSFPMFAKISVKGSDIHPLFQWLVANTEPVRDVEWNFAKFLIDKNGKIVGRFSPRTQPNAPEIVAAIEKALAG